MQKQPLPACCYPHAAACNKNHFPVHREGGHWSGGKNLSMNGAFAVYRNILLPIGRLFISSAVMPFATIIKR